jgi:putative transposase
LESFNSKLRDELLNGEIFYSLAEARVVIESWRQHYNTVRQHSSLWYKPPAPNTLLWPAIKAPQQRSRPMWPTSRPCIRFHPGPPQWGQATVTAIATLVNFILVHCFVTVDNQRSPGTGFYQVFTNIFSAIADGN